MENHVYTFERNLHYDLDWPAIAKIWEQAHLDWNNKIISSSGKSIMDFGGFDNLKTNRQISR